MIRLVVNADDFGYDASVNAGVAEAHARGVVTATTWLAAGAAAGEAVRLAAHHPALDVGLHLALTELPPCADPAAVAPLLDGGRLPRGYPALFAHLRRADVRAAAEAEWAAQYRRFYEAFGHPPSHVDSHQHVALAPPLQDLFLRLAAAHGVGWVRVPGEIERARDLWRGPGGRRLPALALGLLARRFRARTAALGLRTADHFTGFRLTGTLDEAHALRTVAALRPGLTEWAVHPGTASTRDGLARRPERDALTSTALRAALDARGVRLVPFRDPGG
jgi:predicted glycoside hydrolase/deacetylase ChbG (UPF0249 family)